MTRRETGYPTAVGVRTPIGKVGARLFGSHDILTLNEIFCRSDYRVGSEILAVVDLGANIGLASLYFLTRNRRTRVWAVEPNPANVERLLVQVEPFKDRVNVLAVGAAVSDGELEFGFEPTGRYGGAGLDYPEKLRVAVRSTEGLLREVIDEAGYVDVLKIDIESMENPILRSLSTGTAQKVRVVLVEGDIADDVLSSTHERSTYGSITRFTLKS